MKCGLICSTTGSATRHYKVKHAPMQEFKCHICGSVLYNQVYLYAHMRRAHNVKMSDWQKAQIVNRN